MNIAQIAFGLALGLAATGAAQSIYDIDPAHSAAQFGVRHMMISTVKGEFTKVTGTLRYDPAHPAASVVEATIDATTINTREPKRDAHLKSADFFDTAKFPVLTFKSTQVTKSGSGLKINGDLTIHGVTREVVLNVEELTPPRKDPWGYVRIGATATTRINRKDFGLTWNQALEAGGMLVGDEVNITIDLEGVQRKTSTATN